MGSRGFGSGPNREKVTREGVKPTKITKKLLNRLGSILALSFLWIMK